MRADHPVLEKLGIDPSSFRDAEGNVTDLIAVIEQLERAGASPIDVINLFGKIAGPAILKLYKTGSEGLREVESAMHDTGTAARIAEIQQQGAAGATTRLASAYEGLMIAIAESGLLEAFTELVEKATEWVQNLSEANPETLRTIAIIGGIVGVVGPVILTLGAMAKAATVVWQAMLLVKTVTLAVVAGPFAAIIAAGAAAAAVGYLLGKNWDRLANIASRAWGSIKRVVGGAIDWILDKMRALVGFVPDWVVEMFGGDTSGGSTARRRTASTGYALPTASTGVAAMRSPALADPFPRAVYGDSADYLRNLQSKLRIEFGDLPAGATVMGSNLEGIDLDLGFNTAASGL